MEVKRKDIANCFLNLVSDYQEAFPTATLPTIVSLLNPHNEWDDAKHHYNNNNNDDIDALSRFTGVNLTDDIAPYVAYLMHNNFAAYNLKWFCNTNALGKTTLKEDAVDNNSVSSFSPFNLDGDDDVLNNNNSNFHIGLNDNDGLFGNDATSWFDELR